MNDIYTLQVKQIPAKFLLAKFALSLCFMDTKYNIQINVLVLFFNLSIPVSVSSIISHDSCHTTGYASILHFNSYHNIYYSYLNLQLCNMSK